jgi:CheY-like chemotaxis protein
MDADMPGAGGLAGCRSLRNDDATSQVPIILLAMRCAMADAQRVIAQGLCDAALAKPIERDALLREVQSCLA